jgi:uncharacterized membrane protein
MKTIKIILLFLLVAFYVFMGSLHFMQPEQYFAMMPSWLPAQKILIILSGIVEIVLAVLLIPIKTRSLAAKLIIVMLVVFLVAIHIPQSVDFYQTSNEQFITSILRLPIQILFIAWAWMFAKNRKAGVSKK